MPAAAGRCWSQISGADAVEAGDAEVVPTEAVAVMQQYAERINNHRFDDVAHLIAPDAVFWFSDGSHGGLASIRTAFEATWAVLTDEVYWLESLRWIAVGDGAASCIYAFHWQATVDGQSQAGAGRGTTVLAKQPDGWKIVHEHLSRAR